MKRSKLNYEEWKCILSKDLECKNVENDLLNGYISLKTQSVQIDLWGRNLTDNEYTTFYFETMGRGYEQRCKPLQVGVDVRLHF